jgi:hypothetical protein
MKFGASRSTLYDAQQRARALDAFVEEVWTDSARSQYRETVWEPLDQLTTQALRGLDQLAVLLTQVRQECAFDEAG